MSQFYNDSIFWIEVDKIKPNPFQPRREFDEAHMKSLADSIRQYGVLQALVVTRKEVERPDGGISTEYEIIAGERRLRAAKLAGVPAPKVDPAKRMAEWWMIVYSDGSWSYSHYIAGQSAHNWIREVAKDLGIDPKSAQANKLAWFVLTRVSDFKLYSLYQSSGYSADAVKKVILSVLKDSSAYEVPAS